jgi:hypothetical protein
VNDLHSEAIVFSGTVSELGKVLPDKPNVVRGRLARWKRRDVTVTVTRYIQPKSMGQLGKYFVKGGVLDCWAEYIGDDRESVHHDLKEAYLVPLLTPEQLEALTHVSKITGELVRRTPSLADTSLEQMSAFLERVLREGAKNGIEFSEAA